MMVVGVLTLAVAARGSMQLGGLTSAIVGVGAAIFGPFIGAAADRFGQRSTLLITGFANSVVLGLLAVVAFSTLPSFVLMLVGFAVGATTPQISPMSRSRLVDLVQGKLPTRDRPRVLNSVLAYESAVDEVVFVFGPVVVGALATAFGAWAPIAGAAALTLFSATSFALHHTSPPARTEVQRLTALAPASHLWRPGLLITVFGIFCIGLFFGTMLTSLTSFMQDRGIAEQTGLLYGVMGVGSALLAIGVAWFSPRFTMRYRWLVFAAMLTVGGVVLQTADDIHSMLISLLLQGLGIGPLLVTLYGFGATRTPQGRSATVMTMLGSAITLGSSIGSAVAGSIAENQGTQLALLLPLVSTSGALLAGVINWFITPKGRQKVVTAPVHLP